MTRPNRPISHHYRQQQRPADPVRLHAPLPANPSQPPHPSRSPHSGRPLVAKPRRRAARPPGRFILAGGSMLALAAILVNPGAKAPPADPDLCQQQVENRAVLSREQLSEMLSVPERAPKSDIREIVKEPYCIMPSVSLREGAEAVREAYPLAFDPQTWFIVLYENDEYAGYDFSFQR